MRKQLLPFKSLSITVVLILAALHSQAQVGISSTTITPDPSSLLELRSSTSGFLPPRMTTTERDAITSPAAGLLIYNTTTSQLNYYTGSAWQPVVGGGAISSINGLTGSAQTFVNGGNLTMTSSGTTHTLGWTGQLPVNKGGTGLSTFGATNSLLYTSSADNLSSITTANNGILATSGAGVPSIATTLPAAVQSNITSVGTIGTGTWNATAIASAKIAAALTGKTYEGLTLTALGTGFSVAGGTVAKTLTINGDATVSGANTGDQTTITGNAGSATLTAVTDDNATAATMYPTWVTSATGNQAQKTSSTKLTFNPSTGVLASTGFAGALTGNVTGNVSGSAGSATGNAGSATLTAVTDDVATATTVYPTWVGTTSGNQAQKTSSTKLSFNPSTGILTTTGFAGNLTGNVTGNITGNASTVTTNANLTGDVTSVGNGSTIAPNAVTNAKMAQMAATTLKGNNTGSTANASDLTGTQVAAMLPTVTSVLNGLAPASGGGTANYLRADGTWTAPPNSGGTVTTVSVTTANGVSGTVSTATSTPAISLALGAITPTSVAASGTVTGSNLSGTNTGDQTTITGNAGSATLTAVADDNATAAVMYPTWVTTTSGNQSQKTSSTKLTFNPSTGVLTSTGFAGPLTGNVTGNVTGSSGSATGNAGSATLTAVTDDIATVGSVYPTWVSTASGNQAQKTSSSRLSFNPSTGLLTATSFSGSLTGNVTGNASGSAGSATTMATTNDVATNATVYPTWVAATSGNQSAKLSSTKLTFNPSTGILTATGFAGALTGNASTVTTNANLTGDITSVGNASTIAANAVTNAKMAQMAATTIKGNNTGSTANASDLTATQVAAMLPTVSSSANGLAPISPGGTEKYLRADGAWDFPTPGVGVMTATSAAINTTETNLMSYTIPANTLIAGRTYRIELFGTCNTTAANTSNIRVRIGTAGTSADAVAAIISTMSAASGSNVPFHTQLLVTIRSTGASGSATGTGVLTNWFYGTGVSDNGVAVGSPSTATVNTTVSNIIHASYNSSASTTTSTFYVGTIEVLN